MSITEILLGGVALFFAVFFMLAMRLYASEVKEKKGIFQDVIANEGEELRVQKQMLEAIKKFSDDIENTNNIIRSGFEDIRDRLRK